MFSVARARNAPKPTISCRSGAHGENSMVRKSVKSILREEEQAGDVTPFEQLLEQSRIGDENAKGLVLDRLRDKLLPTLALHGLTWADTAPVLDSIEGLEEFQAAYDDPGRFFKEKLEERLEEKITSAGAAAKSKALKGLRPRFEPPLKRRGLAWEEALPALLTALDGGGEFELEDPEALLDKLDKAGKLSPSKDTRKKKGEGAFQFDVAKLPTSLKRMYDLFFTQHSPQSLQPVLKQVAKRYVGFLVEGEASSPFEHSLLLDAQIMGSLLSFHLVCRRKVH